MDRQSPRRHRIQQSRLFIIPRLVGSAIVGDVVLTIYGRGFRTGYYVLLVLTFARLLYSYQGQFLNTLNANGRPDLTFRNNAVFVALNPVLNIAHTSQYGWYGAAAAMTISAASGLGLGYYYARNIIDVIIPVMEVDKQWTAAGVMALVVSVGRLVFGDSLLIVLVLVGIDASIYFVVLLVISRELSTTVVDNHFFRISMHFA